MDADFVAATFEQRWNEFGMNEGVDAGDEEGCGNLVAVEDLEEAGCAGLCAVVGRGESSGFGGAVTKKRGLGIVVEGDEDGYAGVVWPNLWKKRWAHGYGVYGVDDFFV